MFLLDTNVISAGRKGHEAASDWIAAQRSTGLFLSVMTIGEVVRAEMKRRVDPVASARLDEWLIATQRFYSGRILGISEPIAREWPYRCWPYAQHRGWPDRRNRHRS